MKVDNAAIFIGRTRRNKGVNATITDTEIVITNRVTGVEIGRYEIVETAKSGMAWDVRDSDGELRRLTAQQGCGCSGMKPYKTDPEYSGSLS